MGTRLPDLGPQDDGGVRRTGGTRDLRREVDEEVGMGRVPGWCQRSYIGELRGRLPDLMSVSRGSRGTLRCPSTPRMTENRP